MHALMDSKAEHTYLGIAKYKEEPHAVNTNITPSCFLHLGYIKDEEVHQYIHATCNKDAIVL